MTMAAKSFVKRVASGEAGLWPGSGPTLARLDIELTERCNNDCIHCAVNRPAGDAAAREREWPARRWQELLTEAAGLGCLVVRLTGGEPLLRSDFEDIYLHARRLGLRVMLFTNATLLGPRLARLLRDVPPLEAVEVSVYGLTKESAEAVTRTPGSHEACLRGLRLLGENGVPFAVKGAVLPPTRHEVEAFEAWAAGLPGSVGRPSFAVLFDLRSRPDAAQSARIAGLRPDGQAFVRFAAGRDGRAAEEWREFCGRSGRGGGDRLFTCRPGAGASAAVDPYGRLQYCLGLRHPETVYDLASGSLRQAVTEFLPRLRDRRTTNPAYLERCGRCFLKDLCGQCPAKSWAEHGRLDTPVEYLCGIAHAQAVAAGLLGKGEKAWTVPNGPERAQRRNDP
jgi:radical SAM protein with 4Fe4S-binding SPASM domain